MISAARWVALLTASGIFLTQPVASFSQTPLDSVALISDQARAALLRGRRSNDRDAYESALELYTVMVRLGERTRQPLGIANGHAGRGHAFRGLEKVDSARVEYQVALDTTRRVGHQFNEAVHLLSIGRLFMDQQKADSAAYFLEEAVAVTESMREPPMNLLHSVQEALRAVQAGLPGGG